jgi:hypothetical protein
VTDGDRKLEQEALRPQSWLMLDDDDEGEDLSDDEEFMQRWRANRLRDMAAGQGRGARAMQQQQQRDRSVNGGRYGSLVAVDALGYLDAIEKVGRDTVVVVFIYDEQVRCQHPYICFKGIF